MNSIELAVTPSKADKNNTSSWRDMVGIVASIGCAIHCAAMPFVIAYLPALGLSFLADEAFHKWMALVCFLIAIAAFLPGIRTHGKWLPIAIGSVGLVIITFAAFGLAGECCPACEAASADNSVVVSSCDSECQDCKHCASDQAASKSSQAGLLSTTSAKAEKNWLSQIAPWLTPFGGLLLVSAHLLNRRYGCLCGCCGSENEAVSS